MLRFLPTPPDPTSVYHGSYNPSLVTISVLLAILASYAALNASTRIQHSRDQARKLIWLIISAFTMGAGIWSMHFIGMLALSLPCVIHYDLLITLISMVPAVLASGVALGIWNYGTERLSPEVSSLLLGLGIGMMHYTGMAAMSLEGFVAYNPSLFGLSIIVAIALSYLALRVRGEETYLNKKRNVVVAVIMGGAISGMHYTAMFAAYFVRDPVRILPSLNFDIKVFDIYIVLATVFLALTTWTLASVSRNRETTRQLRDSEERLKIATASGQIGIWDYDLQNNKLVWDDVMFALYRVRREDFSGTYDAWSSRLHPEDKAATEAAIQDTIAGIREYNPEFRVVFPDGDIGYIKGHAQVIKDHSGKVIRLIGTNWDNSAYALTQQQLTFAHAAINKSRNAFLWVNDQGRVVDINDCGCQSLGYSREELINQYIWFFDPNINAEYWPIHWEEQKKKLTSTFESRFKRKDGTIFPVEITANYIIVDGKGYCFYFSHDITRRKSNEEQIKQLAFYDPLTQLPNRRLLQERIVHAIEKARRNQTHLALLMFDLDRFKAVNDSLGHRMGDELLQQVATRIKTILRKVDTIARLGGIVARWGGDEFVVLLEDIMLPDNAAIVGNKIIATLGNPFQLTQSDDVRIGASIGIALYPQHGENAEILLDCADTALYRAKELGRGCFAYFSEDLTAAARDRIALEARLRRAIKQHELRVFYQPQIDIATGQMVGAEALVRWQDPTEGLIPPSRFIPIAEETNLIVEIGEWVLRETCKQGRRWLDLGLPPLTLAVNVSPQQFRRSDINALVAEVLAETGYPAGQLELEITESGLMENKDNATAILNKLHAQGVRLAIDDFGTGYSSLAHIKHFPLDVLKIDKSFIDEIPHNTDDMEIASTIVAMGHILGFKVLAEGVETPEQLAFLQKTGCDTYQGYLKSRPVSTDEFVKLLHDQQRTV